jgi:tRNA-dihydrouridine synthase
MRVLLAPMEGVLDSLVRELLTEVNDYDLCVTEFLRVVDMLLPENHSTVSALNCTARAGPFRYAGADPAVRPVS